MENRQYLSLWLGNFKSEQEFYAFVEWIYPDEELDPAGTGLPSSKFSELFKVNYYDLQDSYYEQDLEETVYKGESSKNIKNIVEGISYYKQITKEFTDTKLEKVYNACIEVCDYKYVEILKSYVGEEFYIDYIGTMEYDPDDY